MPSRRTVLGGLGLAGCGVGLYVGAETIRVDALGPTPIPPDTWPLDRYDHRNTARAAVAVPADPSVDWRSGSVGAADPTGLVVGPDAVYAGGTHTGAFDRGDGTRRWVKPGTGGTLALAGARLYAAEGDRYDVSPALRAFSRDGTEQWAVDIGMAGTVFPTADGVIVGDEKLRFVSGDGSVRFEAEVPNRRVFPALYEGRLYVAVTGGIRRYERQTLLDRSLGDVPPVAWDSHRRGKPGPPTVHDGNLLVGYRDFADDGLIRAIAPADGEIEWETALWPPDSDGGRTLTPVVVDGTAVTVAYRDQDGEVDTAIVGLDPADGSERWRRPLGPPPTDIAAGRETVVVGTSERVSRPGRRDTTTGSVIAVEPDGTERWRVALDAGVSSIALVDGTVFTLRSDGRLLALR